MRKGRQSLNVLASGVRIRGGVGELWLHGSKAGLVYDWLLSGWEADWRLEAERYKLDPLIYKNGTDEGLATRDTKVVLDVGPGCFTGKGIIWTEARADGHTHKAIVIKGGNAQWQQKPAAPVTTT